MVNKRKEFVGELIRFYQGFVSGSAESIRTLAKIQKKFEDEYELLKRMKDDPMLIDKMTEDMTEKQKNAFILISARASLLGRKLAMLFDLSFKEQKELADQLDDYAKFVSDKLKEVESE